MDIPYMDISAPISQRLSSQALLPSSIGMTPIRHLAWLQHKLPWILDIQIGIFCRSLGQTLGQLRTLATGQEAGVATFVDGLTRDVDLCSRGGVLSCIGNETLNLFVGYPLLSKDANLYPYSSGLAVTGGLLVEETPRVGVAVCPRLDNLRGR